MREEFASLSGRDCALATATTGNACREAPTDERTTMEAAMSDPSAGARAPDSTPLADVPVTETYPATTYPETTYPAETHPSTGQGSSGGDQSAVKQAAGQSAQAAGQAASDVKDTAKNQA